MVKAVLEPTIVQASQEADWAKTASTPVTQQKILQTINFGLGSFDDQARTFRAIASTPIADRQGDTIDQNGWVLDNFKGNPVIPWAHDYSQPPVGRVTEIGIVDGVLEFTYQAPPKGVSEFADMIWEMYRGRFLFAFSVGFIPKGQDGQPSWEGNDYTSCELLEISAVVVPANPEALALGLKMGAMSKKQARILISRLKSAQKSLEEVLGLDNDTKTVKDNEEKAQDLLRSTDKLTKAADELVDQTMNKKETEKETKETKDNVEEAQEKGLISGALLSLAPKDTVWDSGEAIAAIKKWATVDGKLDFGKYKTCFMWVEDGGGDKQGDYKLPFADIISDEPKAVWNAIKAIYGVLQGARGGVQIPEADQASILTKVKKYYKAFDEGTPGGNDSGKSLTDNSGKIDNENMVMKKLSASKSDTQKVQAVIDAMTDTAGTLQAHSKALKAHADTMNAHSDMVSQKADYLLNKAASLKTLLSPVNQGDESSENETNNSTLERGDGMEPPEGGRKPSKTDPDGDGINDSADLNDKGKSEKAEVTKAEVKGEVKSEEDSKDGADPEQAEEETEVKKDNDIEEKSESEETKESEDNQSKESETEKQDKEEVVDGELSDEQKQILMDRVNVRLKKEGMLAEQE